VKQQILEESSPPLYLGAQSGSAICVAITCRGTLVNVHLLQIQPSQGSEHVNKTTIISV
jgi:hypothetical protein